MLKKRMLFLFFLLLSSWLLIRCTVQDTQREIDAEIIPTVENSAITDTANVTDTVNVDQLPTITTTTELSQTDILTDTPVITQPDEESSAGYRYLAQAEAGDFNGKTVTILGKWTGMEGKEFKDTLAAFAERTGIDINYGGSDDFETLIQDRVKGGNAPDLAFFSDPELMAQYIKSGHIIDLNPTMGAQLAKDYSPAWIDLATADGKLGGVFFRASTKSTVWYPVKAFEEAGYEIPTTWDEMLALSDRILAEQKVAPWCISIFHEGVTGWVATDWIEDVLLRTAPPETYDKWVNHEIPFDDPAIVAAVDTVGELWFKEGYVYGGKDAILNTFVGDTQQPMFEEKPQCWFHRQGGWISKFWTEGKTPGVDSSFFYLSPIDPAYSKPISVDADIVSAFADRPEVLAVIEYMATADAVKGAIMYYSIYDDFVSPNRSIPEDWYHNYVNLAQAQILKEATTLRFDASDAMPQEVGSGTFFSAMVDWVKADGTNTAEVLKKIDESWPDSSETPVDEPTEEIIGEEVSIDHPAAYKNLASAESGAFKGTSVTILKWTAPEEIEDILENFVRRTGININYESSDDLETLIQDRVTGGNIPDLVIFSDPALMAQYIKSGHIIDLNPTMGAQLAKDYSPAWIESATADGKLGGVFFRASNMGGIVWYPVKAFEEAGYEIPTTWDEMLALSDRILAEQKVTPWCIGVADQYNPSWIAPSWIEDVLMRTASPETYDKWISHEISFNDPVIVKAVDKVGELWFKEGYVYGGKDAILNTFIVDAQQPMFEEKPQCWFHRQAGWISRFWPEGKTPGVDSSFFYLPPIDPKYGKPVLGRGDVVSAFTNRPEVLAVIEYLATADAVKDSIMYSIYDDFVSPNRSIPEDWYHNYVNLAQAQILREATTFRLDVLNAMPQEIINDAFFPGMVDWVEADGTNTAEVLKKIDESWPTPEPTPTE